MGVFGDLRALQKQAKEIDRTWDPAAQMRAGMASMQAATAALQQQAAAAAVLQNGQPATATILSLVDTGTRVNHEAMATMSLLVQVDGRPPYPVTITATIPFVAGPQASPGQQVRVMVDRANPEIVAVQWGQ